MMRSRAGAWWPVLGFALLILAVSSIPAHSMPSSESLWRFDKLIHATEYGILSALLHRAMRVSFTWNIVLLSVLCALACAAFGGLDELYQSTTPGRDSSVFDALADLTGAGFASILSAVLYSRQRSLRGHHPQL